MPVGNTYSELVLKNGGWPGFWELNHKSIGELIRAKDLKPLTQQQIRANAKQLPIIDKELVQNELILKPYLKNGGIKAPHLHYNNEIFLLEREQWQDFSKEVIKGFQEKLSQVNSINYAQLMELSGAIEGLV